MAPDAVEFNYTPSKPLQPLNVPKITYEVQNEYRPRC
jgi:hypothetical protein